MFISTTVWRMALLPRAESSNLSAILEGPALDPPPGVTVVTITNSDPAQRYFYPMAVLCTVVPGLLLLLRIYTKLRILRKFDLTDYLSTVAFLFFIGMIICARATVNAGAGVHQWNLQRKHYIDVLYWMNIEEIIYAPTIWLVKLAILWQYTVILAPYKEVNRVMYIGARVLIVVNLIYYIISTCITIWACSPREKIWKEDLVPGKCLNNDLMIFITCFWNIVSDIAILILPVRSIWRLRIETRKKIGIAMLFTTGILACACNAIIVYYLVVHMSSDDSDISYNSAWIGFWALAEIAFGLIVPCTLSLPKFMEFRGNSILASLVRPFQTLRDSFGSGSRSSRRDPSTTGGTGNSAGQDDLEGLQRLTVGLSTSQTNMTLGAASEHEMETFPPRSARSEDSASVNGFGKNVRAAESSYR